jgi:hypothetical protein
MMKLYTPKSPTMEQPRPETIQYLINYSKQMRIVKTNKNFIEFELNLN